MGLIKKILVPKAKALLRNPSRWENKEQGISGGPWQPVGEVYFYIRTSLGTMSREATLDDISAFTNGIDRLFFEEVGARDAVQIPKLRWVVSPWHVDALHDAYKQLYYEAVDMIERFRFYGKHELLGIALKEGEGLEREVSDKRRLKRFIRMMQLSRAFREPSQCDVDSLLVGLDYARCSRDIEDYTRRVYRKSPHSRGYAKYFKYLRQGELSLAQTMREEIQKDFEPE